MSLESEPSPSPRIGDAERDEAVDLLQEHLAAGRLDNSEFNDRLDTALGAKTQGELVPLFLDLPGRRPGEPVPAPVPVPAVPSIGAAELDRRKRIGGIVIGSLWPLGILLGILTGQWWFFVLPIFLTGILGQIFGVWGGDDRNRHRNRNA